MLTKELEFRFKVTGILTHWSFNKFMTFCLIKKKEELEDQEHELVSKQVKVIGIAVLSMLVINCESNSHAILGHNNDQLQCSTWPTFVARIVLLL